MKIIYVVTAGSYSDYGIYGVFSEKEKAQAFADSGTFDSGNQDSSKFLLTNPAICEIILKS